MKLFIHITLWIILILDQVNLASLFIGLFYLFYIVFLILSQLLTFLFKKPPLNQRRQFYLIGLFFLILLGVHISIKIKEHFMVQTISEIESELKNNVQVDKGAYPPKLTEIQRERLDYYRVRVTVKYCSDKDAFRIVYFLGDIYLGTEVSDDSLENLCSDIKKEIIHVL